MSFLLFNPIGLAFFDMWKTIFRPGNRPRLDIHFELQNLNSWSASQEARISELYKQIPLGVSPGTASAKEAKVPLAEQSLANS